MECKHTSGHSPASAWIKDILGNDFERRTIVLPDDYDGPVCCTVVRIVGSTEQNMRRGVLYVHGFSDYFFQADMARKFAAKGYAFYAVDLRRYGRSLLSGQKPFRVRDLREYFADIEATLKQMADDGIHEVALMAHSTGGLTCSLMMKECPPPQVKALILNSPFIAWNLPAFLRTIAVPAISWLGRFMPGLPASQPADPLYASALHKRYDGEWDYDRRWKPDCLPPVDAGWIRAIDTAQRALRRLPAIEVPVLLLHSDRSVTRRHTLEEHHRADAILDVEAISKAGRHLGPLVTDIAIPGGIHDLALSRPDIRAIFYHTIFNWLATTPLSTTA